MNFLILKTSKQKKKKKIFVVCINKNKKCESQQYFKLKKKIFKTDYQKKNF